MQAWFSLHPLSPAIIEVKALHHFDWLSKGKVPVLEAMEKDQRVRSQFRSGSSVIAASKSENPVVVAAKLQAPSPKYNSLVNHIRNHLPELFPSLNKVVFLDDDIVIQTDLLPLWDIDMDGKFNGAVETCRGEDKFVMSKKFKKLKVRPEFVAAGNFTSRVDSFPRPCPDHRSVWHMLGLGYQETTSFSDLLFISMEELSLGLI
ncbi:hypothetical protein IGI04_009958 [Brassica rapa subsp. trilocularis]|uniref:Hexosyltransferase n=1 Tax=Brassica rapa subsp. trilocularis TaxID=1813537 RepID=A0ABQ7MYR6_BRACM|nr:hypothetical protein IGI04_009958 [Brassica rapa subsp. trilocularis]